jgi:CYTH domain
MNSGQPDWLETETKYEVVADFALPGLTGLQTGLGVTGPTVQELAASYYDTPDLRLASAGITLRRRTGGTDAGWHLKLPVAPGTRREVRVPLGQDEAAVPGDLAARVSGWTAGQPLRLIAILETTRTLRRITGPAGEDLAEIADDLVVGRRLDAPAAQPPDPAAGGGPSVTWREIEVELIAGGPGVLTAAGARLRAAGARPSSSASKLNRVLGIAGPITAGPATTTGPATTGAAPAAGGVTR